MRDRKDRSRLHLILLVTILLGGCMANAQTRGIYPPFTKWYQDPLGLKPLQLSSAFGFFWGSAAVAASLIFTTNEPGLSKSKSVYYETGLSTGYKSPYTLVFQNNIGYMYKLRKWLAAGLELNSYRFKDHSNDTWGFGIRPFARWYAYEIKVTRVFFEYGAGLAYSLDKFPLTGTGWEADTARFGTKFNFTSKYSIGIEVHLNKRISLESGFRHFHLSNGNLAGIKRNPSHDSNGLFVGLIYTAN
jgi:hypothetical protein